MNFTKKVVIVTGASSGIGASSAVLFARFGASLSLVGRNEERLRNVAMRCQEANGIPPLCIRLDLTAQGACSSVIALTVATYGRIDVLVNCAAKFVLGSLFDETFDAFDELLNINLRVPYKLTRLAMQHLIRTKGNIVNLSITKCSRVRHGFLPYVVTKAALEQLTKSAAIELAAAGVRVNGIQPGVTKTNLLGNLGVSEEDIENAYEEVNSEITILNADEIANMVVFLASDSCPSMNGVHIKLDAAQSLDFC